MSKLRVLTAVEQVAAHLREELLRGVWSGRMPGGDRLTAELGVGRNTVEGALLQLEREGLLVNQGAGRQRRIVLPAHNATRPLRVAILNFDLPAFVEGYMVELQHLLEAAGHSAFFTEKSLLELGMSVPRIRSFVEKTEADAWVVCAATREVLEWFAGQPFPAFSLFGRRAGLPMAGVGPDTLPIFTTVTRELIRLGHRRIVLLSRPSRHTPTPWETERFFLREMEAHGIPTGPYNLPDWEETTEGFHKCLEELFRATPPTALIVDEACFFIATQQFLASRKLLVPGDVSLISTDAEPLFAWCKPSITHIYWDTRMVVRHVVRWANKVARGKESRRQIYTKAEFVEGGTIGPAKG